jgi:predicted amidohydrolase YtcJ
MKDAKCTRARGLRATSGRGGRGRRLAGIGFGAVLVLGIGACSPDQSSVTPQAVTPSADLVLINGRIYTGESGQPWVQALAIREGRFLALGETADMSLYAGDATQIIDLDGRMAMPGIIDAHLHPVSGALDVLYNCNFAFTATADEVRTTLEACVDAAGDAEWISGGRWGSGFFSVNQVDSPRAFLDAIASDKAIVLVDDSGHNAWVNSLALERFGIDATTPDPEGGSFGRDADGNPNGLLLETAAKTAFDNVPPPGPERYLAAVAKAVELLNAFGITGMKDAGAAEASLPAYAQISRKGGMTMHTDLSIRTFYGRRDLPLSEEALASIDKARAEHAGAGLTLDTVKIFLDGVPTPARTAAMLAPYLTDAAHPVETTGELHVDADDLASDLVALEQRGFRVKIHAAGDRSIRVALDAIEAARRVSGKNEPVHELAHAGYIDEADLPRFAAMDVAADISPVLWHPSPIIDSIVTVLGERGKHYWPVRAFLDSGARVFAGSDWPSAVPSANPWVGIESLVTRADPYGESPGTLWPEQAVSLEEAIRIYTVNGAHAIGRPDETGSIRVGKSADVIVLDRNLFEIAPDAIGETAVVWTWFAGKLVYGAP